MSSEAVTLDEFVLSQTVARLGIDNTPDATVLSNLRRLARALEQVRTALGGAPVLVRRGYRSLPLSKAVKGASNSAHVVGLAVDFTAPRFGTVLQRAKARAASGVVFDRIVHELGHWVHRAIPAPDPQAQVATLSIMTAGVHTPGLRSRGRGRARTMT